MTNFAEINALNLDNSKKRMKILAFTKKENMTNDGQRKKSWPTKKFLATSKKKSSPRLGAAVFDLAKKGSIIQGHNKKNGNLGLHKKDDKLWKA